MTAQSAYRWVWSAFAALGLLLALAVSALPQAGASGQEQQPPPPPPKQEPGGSKTGGGGSGVSTGVGVNIGDVIGLFRKHVKIHLDATPKQAQAGDFIAFSTKVTPNAAGLTYEYHWSQDKAASGELEKVATINHAYPAAGEYKAWVVVYLGEKKVGSSNEVKIQVTGSIASNPPPPDKVPPTIKPQPTPAVVQNPSTATNTTASTQGPTPPKPEPVPTQTPNPPKIGKPSPPPPKVSKPEQPPTVATTPPATDVVVPPSPPQKIEYSLELYYNPHPEVGKPVDFRVELNPAPPANQQVKYCFYWGDGDPPSCQNSPLAVHEYRARGRYLAAVEAYANEEKLASREEKLATSGNVTIDAVSPGWITLLPYLAIILVVAAATYGTYKIRKMTRFTVTAYPGTTRHAIPQNVQRSGDVLRIRCVRSGARSEVIFTAPAQTTERTAHV